ncbi:hypothetical protein [Nocardioides sp. SYSU D00065]|uniref:hypothetical protein n=1 Tax=Nocardioides sp. SYSU D00065 TaxID=2817378 RepID=UPI001B31D7CC|nr:hypothetical protein [Nocardioides sp. SYSU D00065]
MPFGRKKSLVDRAHDYVEQLSDTVIPQLESAWEQAVEKAAPALADARDKAQPLIAEGRTVAAERAAAGAAIAAAKAAEAREKAAPLLTEGRALAAEKAAVGAALAAEKAAVGRELAAVKVAELRGQEPEPQKGGRLKKFFLVGALLAIGGVVFSKLRSKQDADANWQSTYVPPAPPAPSTPPTPASPAATSAAPATGDPLTDPLPDEVTAADVVTADPPATQDVGGGAPGEAISDAVEEPAPATTPDDPAEVIDIDDPQRKQ